MTVGGKEKKIKEKKGAGKEKLFKNGTNLISTTKKSVRGLKDEVSKRFLHQKMQTKIVKFEFCL